MRNLRHSTLRLCIKYIDTRFRIFSVSIKQDILDKKMYVKNHIFQLSVRL